MPAVTKVSKPNNPSYHLAKSIYEFSVLNLDGEPVKLDKYRGHVCIIVNTATKSSFTAVHYEQFNILMDKFGGSKGLRILVFPCNQFGQEEPCTSQEIAKHAIENKVEFDVYAKVNVNCNNAIPLYKFLKSHLKGQKLGDMVKWSYTKFIVNKLGQPVERYGPEILPSEMENILNCYFSETKKELIK